MLPFYLGRAVSTCPVISTIGSVSCRLTTGGHGVRQPLLSVRNHALCSHAQTHVFMEQRTAYIQINARRVDWRVRLLHKFRSCMYLQAAVLVLRHLPSSSSGAHVSIAAEQKTAFLLLLCSGFRHLREFVLLQHGWKIINLIS